MVACNRRGMEGGEAAARAEVALMAMASAVSTWNQERRK
jgi:hypothetical protein